MNRTEILAAADRCVSVDRAATYGDAAATHAEIAGAWSWWLGVPVTAHDAAMMLALMKVARAKVPGHADNYVDLAGYAALAGEIATSPFRPAAS